MIRFRISQSRRSISLGTALLVALAIFAVASAEARAAEARVMVAAETVAKSDRLTLGHIAQIDSDDEQVSELLRKIELGYAPDVGAIRELTLESIAQAIKATGLLLGRVRVEGPSVVLVRRASQIVDPSSVREAVERVVLSELKATGAAARLVRLDLPSLIEVPAGATEVRASTGTGRNLFVPFTVSIEIWAEGRLLRRLNATAQVEAFASVLVVSRDLPRGVRVREEDVRVEPRRLNQPLSYYLRDAKALRGVAVRRALARGEALMTDNLIAEMIVKPGDSVRIIGQSGSLYIEVKGEARSAGRVGDRIQVRNTQSGILLQATVEDEGLVRVHF